MEKFNINTIDKFTGDSRYHVTHQLNRFDTYIDNEVREGLQLNPDFQRGHVWTEEQQVAFVEFALRGGTIPPFRFNHPNWMGSFQGDFVVVDGLQRITALCKFLKNELGIFGGHLRKDIEGIELHLRGVQLSVTVNDLKTKQEVLKWYVELNEGGTPHTKEEIERVKQLMNS